MPTEVMEKTEPTSYQIAQKIQSDYRSDPLYYVDSWFGKDLWAKQQEIFLAIRDHARVAVRSGNTVGKSYVVALIALWYLMSHYPSKVVTTAPTNNQIENILWKEIANLYHNAKQPIGGDLLQTELRLTDDCFAIGFSTKDDVNRFQGFHSPNLLVILDEALGVAPMIWEAIEGLHPSKILAIGNPLDDSGNFYDCFSSPIWHKIGISCQECVDWQDKNGVIPGLVTQQWIDERRDDWGEKSPVYIARVLGEFPEEGTDTLIPTKYIEAARLIDNNEEEDAIKIVSADIATKHGSAQTVVAYRIGNTMVEMDGYSQVATTMTYQAIKHKYEVKQAHSIVIDSDGIGEGIADRLQQYHLGFLEFHGGYGHKAIESTTFKNLRSQFYWMVAKKFEKGLYSLKELPEHIYQKLKTQLSSIKLKKLDGLSRIQVETKDDMRARQIFFLDYADTFMMSEFAYYMGRLGDIKPQKWRV